MKLAMRYSKYVTPTSDECEGASSPENRGGRRLAEPVQEAPEDVPDALGRLGRL